MNNRRFVLAALPLIACGGSQATPDPDPVKTPPEAVLSLQVITSPEMAGAVNSTLITGPTELVIVDAQFTKSGATAVADAAAATGLKVSSIFITHAHPDHYLGTAVLAARFPDATVIATDDVVREMKASAAAVAAKRKDMLGPEFPGEPVIPTAVDSLAVDGVPVAILPGLAGDTHPISVLHVESLGALIVSDIAYADVHPWTATTDHDGRLAWAKQAEALAAMEGIRRVIPGHQLGIRHRERPRLHQSLRARLRPGGQREQDRRRAARRGQSRLSEPQGRDVPAVRCPGGLRPEGRALEDGRTSSRAARARCARRGDR